MFVLFEMKVNYNRPSLFDQNGSGHSGLNLGKLTDQPQELAYMCSQPVGFGKSRHC